MTDQELGRIEEVDLREVWPNEAVDFTPWLAKHLDLLGEALHLDELSLVEAEGEVGPFAVDIVAEADNGVVVIENQLERTDHSHLGQLLTYAAGRDARILIWITPQFRDEHRAALDWLNNWTPEEIAVYGVEVRAIKIGDSPPAPELRPIAFPNTWSRQVRRASTSRAASEQSEQYRDFYQPLIDEARKRGWTTKARATAVRYQQLPSAADDRRVRFNFEFPSSRQSRKVYVGLSIRSRNMDVNEQIFAALASEREQIDAAIPNLEWISTEGRISAALRVHGEGSIDDPPEQHDAIRAWMLKTLGMLRDELNPRLEALAIGDAEE